jgi:NOL1/NOP2/fmu family ribosome biogenesis protein
MVGMKAFQRINRFVKPTTKMIRIFGRDATRATLNIEERHLRRLGAGEHLPVNLEIENGYVILAFKGHILGLGLLIDGTVRSQIPKKERRIFTSSSMPLPIS